MLREQTYGNASSQKKIVLSLQRLKFPWLSACTFRWQFHPLGSAPRL